MKSNKIVLSWSSYLSLIDQLYKKINWKKEKFDWIVAINRGGNIPATCLAHKTDIKLLVINNKYHANQIFSYRPEFQRLLLIDDIVDKGQTLNGICQNIPSPYVVKSATLHIRKGTSFVPDYYVKEIDKWVQYPYE